MDVSSKYVVSGGGLLCPKKTQVKFQSLQLLWCIWGEPFARTFPLHSWKPSWMRLLRESDLFSKIGRRYTAWRYFLFPTTGSIFSRICFRDFAFSLYTLDRVWQLPQLSDKCRPGATISCRCRVAKDGTRLDIHKPKFPLLNTWLVIIALCCCVNERFLPKFLIEKYKKKREICIFSVWTNVSRSPINSN